MRDPLWTFRELAQAVGASAADGPDIGGICIDSRRLAGGDLFVALAGDPGPRFTATSRSDRDGHDFIDDAVAKGAAAVLAHRPGDYRAPTLLVEDTLDSLWHIGAAARRRLSAPVVAVTGSSGKTTFKSFAAAVLGAFATDGSLNNHIGVPLSLARAPRDANGAVCEIGTNHPGEIAPLSKLVAPHVAVVLNVHPAHIENFGTLEAIRREKASIAEGLGDGGVLVHAADVAVDFDGRRVTFGGADEDADVRLAGLRRGREGSVAVLDIAGGRVEAPVPAGGVHRARSVAALAAVLLALDVPLDALEKLAALEVPRGRGNVVEAGGVALVDESYNANPESMKATLDAFAASPERQGGRRIAVLGDMLELGADAVRHHRELAAHCENLHGVFCVGARMRALHDALAPRLRLGHAEEADAAFVERCAKALEVGDRVLVKGSNGTFWAKGFVAALTAALDDGGGADSGDGV